MKDEGLEEKMMSGLENFEDDLYWIRQKDLILVCMRSLKETDGQFFFIRSPEDGKKFIINSIMENIRSMASLLTKLNYLKEFEERFEDFVIKDLIIKDIEDLKEETIKDMED